MFKSLTEENRKAFFDLFSLLIVIYCSAILGDYISEALVIKRLSVNVLPRLFQLNAFLLFAVSFILFGIVDKLNRWMLIRILSVGWFIIVAGCGLLLRKYAAASVALYAAAYISKLSLFVVFWIIANDICDTRKSKAVFPILAGAGLCGGLLVSIIAGKLIHRIHVENFIWVWAGLLLLPGFIVEVVKREYGYRLRAQEPEKALSLKGEFLEVFRERAVLIMAAVYFLVFLLIFNVDFIFAKTLSRNYQYVGGFHAEGFVALKFNVFIVVTSLIIFFQTVYTSSISRRFGVTGSLLILPITFAVAFAALYGLKFGLFTDITPLLFNAVVAFYVLRQFLFETLFSSNYQIFFSAFSRRFRGRGKLLLEGLVKPLGISAAGLVILIFQFSAGYTIFLAVCAVLLAVLVYMLKTEYSRILLREEVEIPKDDIMQLMKREISGKNRDKILSLISRAMDAQDYDLKRFSIKYLEYSGSPAAFEILRKKFFEETDRIKELIANSLSTFDTLEARGFLRSLLENKNAAIRAGALKSIRKNPALRPKRFDFHSLIYDHHPLVFEEASLLLHAELSREEIAMIAGKTGEFLGSERLDEVVTAIRLVGSVKQNVFFDRVVKLLEAPSRDVFRSAVDAILAFDNERSVYTLVEYIDRDVDRAKENYIIQGLGRVSLTLYGVVEGLFLNARRKRTAFSLINVMRLMSVQHLRDRGKPIRQRSELKERLMEMAMQEMNAIYVDVYRYYDLRLNLPTEHKAIDLLRDAILTKRQRFSLFVLNMLALIDNSGALLNIDRDFKVLDGRDKANIIELIEAFGEKNISRFLTPILEEFTERDLLKIGSQKWPYHKGYLDEAVKYFMDLDNRWINLIALYISHRARKNAA